MDANCKLNFRGHEIPLLPQLQGLRLILKMKQTEIKDVIKFDKVTIKSLYAPAVLNILCMVMCDFVGARYWHRCGWSL